MLLNQPNRKQRISMVAAKQTVLTAPDKAVVGTYPKTYEFEGKIFTLQGFKNGKPKYSITRDYYKVSGLSNSSMSFLKQSAAHYKAYLDGELELNSKALEMGRALHLAFLEPEKMHWQIKEKWGGAGCKARIEAQREYADANDIILLTEQEAQMMNAFFKNASQNPEVVEIITQGFKEEDIFFQYRGINCKAKIDARLGDHTVADLKFVVDGEPDSFMRKGRRLYDYDRQASWYMNALRTVGKVKEDAVFKFIVFEKSPPYPVTIIEVAPSILVSGQRKYDAIIDYYLDTVAQGKFPCYQPAVWEDAIIAMEEEAREENEKAGTFSLEEFAKLALAEGDI